MNRGGICALRREAPPLPIRRCPAFEDTTDHFALDPKSNPSRQRPFRCLIVPAGRFDWLEGFRADGKSRTRADLQRPSVAGAFHNASRPGCVKRGRNLSMKDGAPPRKAAAGRIACPTRIPANRSEEHTSELQSL